MNQNRRGAGSPVNRGLLRSLVVLLAFAGFQALLALWLVTDTAPVIPNLGYAEDALERRDYAEAIRHLRPLAASGSARAHCLLGQLYMNGHGVPRDLAAAVNHLEAAADGGAIKAQYLLSRLYSLGQGVPRNLVRTHFWLSLAALHEHRDAPGLLSLLERMMSPAEIEQAWALAEKKVPGARSRISRE